LEDGADSADVRLGCVCDGAGLGCRRIRYRQTDGYDKVKPCDMG
jgi:hypothetical protein